MPFVSVNTTGWTKFEGLSGGLGNVLASKSHEMAAACGGGGGDAVGGATDGVGGGATDGAGGDAGGGATEGVGGAAEGGATDGAGGEAESVPSPQPARHSNNMLNHLMRSLYSS